MKRNHRFLTFGAVLAAILLFSLSAYAYPFSDNGAVQPTSFPGGSTMGLYLNNGATNIFVYDNGAGDSNPVVGAVTFSGAVGTWSVNVSTAISYPVQGSVNSPFLDLNSVNIGGTGTLEILATAGFFNTPSPSGATLAIGGTAAQSADFAAWYCYANWPFHRDFIIADPSAFGTGAFSGTYNGSLTYANLSNYSLTIQALLNGTGTTSFDAELKVPEPSVLLLLGAGLLGLAAIRRKK